MEVEGWGFRASVLLLNIIFMAPLVFDTQGDIQDFTFLDPCCISVILKLIERVKTDIYRTDKKMSIILH